MCRAVCGAVGGRGCCADLPSITWREPLGQECFLACEKDAYLSCSQAWESLAGAGGVAGRGRRWREGKGAAPSTGRRQVTRLSLQGSSSDSASTLPGEAFPVRVLKAYSVRAPFLLLLLCYWGGAGRCLWGSRLLQCSWCQSTTS